MCIYSIMIIFHYYYYYNYSIMIIVSHVKNVWKPDVTPLLGWWELSCLLAIFITRSKKDLKSALQMRILHNIHMNAHPPLTNISYCNRTIYVGLSLLPTICLDKNLVKRWDVYYGPKVFDSILIYYRSALNHENLVEKEKLSHSIFWDGSHSKFYQ